MESQRAEKSRRAPAGIFAEKFIRAGVCQIIDGNWKSGFCLGRCDFLFINRIGKGGSRVVSHPKLLFVSAVSNSGKASRPMPPRALGTYPGYFSMRLSSFEIAGFAIGPSASKPQVA